MSEQEPHDRHEPAPASWQDFTALLPEATHRRLLIAMGAGLQEARRASEVATQNGPLVEAIGHLVTAIAQLTDALDIVAPPDSR